MIWYSNPNVASGAGIVVHGTRGSDIAGGGPVTTLNIGHSPSNAGGVEADLQYRTTRAGILRRMRGRMAQNTIAGGPVVVTVRVNGVSTALTFAIPAGDSSDFAVDVDVPVVDGDDVAVQADPSGAGSGSITMLIVSYELS